MVCYSRNSAHLHNHRTCFTSKDHGLNKACSGRVGFRGIFWHFPTFKFFLLSSIIHTRPLSHSLSAWVGVRQIPASVVVTRYNQRQLTQTDGLHTELA